MTLTQFFRRGRIRPCANQCPHTLWPLRVNMPTHQALDPFLDIQTFRPGARLQVLGNLISSVMVTCVMASFPA